MTAFQKNNQPLTDNMLSLAALANSPLVPQDFHYPHIVERLEAKGFYADDFYYIPDNQKSPYVFHRGIIYLEFTSIEAMVGIEMNSINQMEKSLHEIVARKDFYAFFAAIHPSIIAELFVEVFYFIPDDLKYPLYQHLRSQRPPGFEELPDEFVTKVNRYKQLRNKNLIPAEDGTVTIFTADLLSDDPSSPCRTWFDLSKVISHTLCKNPSPVLYRAQIPLELVENKLTSNGEEAFVEPDEVHWENMNQLTLNNAMLLMESSPKKELRKQYEGYIQTDWFHNPDGIHALGHTKRVLFLVFALASLQHLDEPCLHTLCKAAIYHDIGRITDGYDPKHGQASYRKLIQKNLLQGSPVDLEALRFIIENHAIPDHKASEKLAQYELSNREQTIQLFHLFKDADGLDRVRLGDLKASFLRTPEAHRLILLAHQLYRQSGECSL